MRILIIIHIALLSLFIASCNNRANNELKIPELLLLYTKENSIDYRDMLNNAISGDLVAIREFSLQNFRDAVAYDHGCLLLDLINVIGEETFIMALNAISDKQKIVVKGYIIAGLEYGNHHNPEPADFKVVFPKIFAFLCK